jgi:hypothetical protein
MTWNRYSRMITGIGIPHSQSRMPRPMINSSARLLADLPIWQAIWTTKKTRQWFQASSLAGSAENWRGLAGTRLASRQFSQQLLIPLQWR